MRTSDGRASCSEILIYLVLWRSGHHYFSPGDSVMPVRQESEGGREREMWGALGLKSGHDEAGMVEGGGRRQQEHCFSHLSLTFSTHPSFCTCFHSTCSMPGPVLGTGTLMYLLLECPVPREAWRVYVMVPRPLSSSPGSGNARVEND